MSLDQETDTMVFGSVGKASLAADLRIVNKNSQLSFKRNACQFFWTSSFTLHKLDDAFLLFF